MAQKDVNAPSFIQVGTGGFGAYWCKEFMARLVRMGRAVPAAVVDINPDNLQNAIEGYGITQDRCFTDVNKAFDEVEADFAVIVVPPAFHEQVVDLALAHDMDILSEKPIADTMEACVRVWKKVKKSGKKMGVTMSHRFDSDKQTLERLVRSGELGELNYIITRFTHNCRKFGSWGEFRHKIPDALLIEGAVHHFDILRALTGSNAKTVYARTWNPRWGEYAGDSTGLVTFDMENGSRCFYEGAKANATTMNGWTNEYFRVECEFGTAELDRRRIKLMRGGGWEAPSEEEIPLLDQDAWMNYWLIEQFLDWIAGGPAMVTNVDDNINCCAMVFGAIESAHSGQPVDLQEYLQRYVESVQI